MGSRVASRTRLRTLHVIASTSVANGGDVRATLDLCAGLTMLGERCELATLVSSGGARADEDLPAPPGVRVHRFRPSPPRPLGNSFHFARWLLRRARDYDLIEVHGVFRATSLIAAAIARLRAVPYIVHPHGSLDPFDLRKHHVYKRALAPLFVRLLLRHASAILLTSAQEAAGADTFGATTERYHIPPLILDGAAPGSRYRFRASLGAGEQTFLLLFMSRIDYKKGLIRTLRATALLAERGVDLRLVIAGSGDRSYEAEVRSAVDRLGLAARVSFAGFLGGQRKADALAGADAFILVSDNENFGVVVLEALRAGLPTVISDRVAIAGELAAAGAAFVVPPDDLATADAIAALAGEPVLARRLSRRGQRAAELLYDWRTVVGPQHDALRRRLIDGRPTRAAGSRARAE